MVLIQNHLAMEDTMSASLSIKDVPEETLLRLRARAERNHRSLQKELLAIVETAAIEEESELTVDELAQYVGDLGLSTPDEATGWIRAHRDAL
jgi:plasmid stability protein